MVRAFLFDIGNVILAFDFGKAAQRIESQCECSAAQILERVSTLTETLELGKITPQEFYDQAIELIGYQGDRAFLAASFEDIFEVNEPMVAAIEAIHKAGLPLHLLSNTNGIHVPFFEATYPVFALFEGRIYSHEVGMMKPNPRIYGHVVTELGLEPTTTVYIDDLAANCEAGRDAGFISILYDRSDHESFRQEVRNIAGDIGL